MPFNAVVDNNPNATTNIVTKGLYYFMVKINNIFLS